MISRPLSQSPRRQPAGPLPAARQPSPRRKPGVVFVKRASCEEIAREARRLFNAWAFRPVQLIGVGVSELTQGTEEQLGLFSVVQSEQQRAIDRASDTIIERFGRGAIRRGGTLS